MKTPRHTGCEQIGIELPLEELRMFRLLAIASVLPMLIGTVQAMGPDPGGKTGQGVTSESTRTDHPQGDKAIREGDVKDPRTDDRAENPDPKQQDQRR